MKPGTGLTWLLVLAAAAGCGPGVADFQERIGDSDLFYVSTGIVQRYINRISVDHTQENVLGARVVTYFVHDGIVFVAKQPSEDWECAGGALITTVERALEYWTISTVNLKVDGPYPYVELMPLAEEAGVVAEYEEMAPEMLAGRLIEVPMLSCDNPRRL